VGRKGEMSAAKFHSNFRTRNSLKEVQKGIRSGKKANELSTIWEEGNRAAVTTRLAMYV
jgi:hypothetical protein